MHRWVRLTLHSERYAAINPFEERISTFPYASVHVQGYETFVADSEHSGVWSELDEDAVPQVTLGHAVLFPGSKPFPQVAYALLGRVHRAVGEQNVDGYAEMELLFLQKRGNPALREERFDRDAAMGIEGDFQIRLRNHRAQEAERIEKVALP